MRKFIIIILVLFFSTLSSCYQSNAIYFDIKEQSIKSCNQKGLRRLYIKNDSIAEVYSLVWNDTMNTAPQIIKLISIDTSYRIYEGWNNKNISNNSFKLKPFSRYIIERVQGDASAYKIKVWTDETGNINKTDQEFCKD